MEAEQVQALLRDASLSSTELAEKILACCASVIANSKPNSNEREGDAPGLASFLYSLWGSVLETAQDDEAARAPPVGPAVDGHLSVALSLPCATSLNNETKWNEPMSTVGVGIPRKTLA